MTKVKKAALAAATALAFALPGAGMAQSMGDTGWYVNGSIGQADAVGEKDTAWRIAGGYRVNRTFGVELGYANLSDFGFGGDDVTSLEVVGTAGFPIANQLSVYGLAGIARLEADDENETELTFGVGLQYDFSRNMGVRAQWQRYNTDEEIDVLSVGVVVKF